MNNTYIDVLKNDSAQAEIYYRKSVNKTEQHKFLEKLLGNKKYDSFKIADVACGGGTLSYHLKNRFPNSQFYLSDFNYSALEIAKQINKDSNFEYSIDDIYQMSTKSNFYDFTFCWQTLSWLEQPQKALSELIRITKPAGKIYASSLFNIEHDVDIYSKVLDHTRNSGQNGFFMNYNTYSSYSIKNWLGDTVSDFFIHKFKMKIDLPKDVETKGIGTYTKKIARSDERLQISGGMLMNWGILEITKCPPPPPQSTYVNSYYLLFLHIHILRICI